MSMIDEHPTEALLDGRYRLASCVGRGGTALVYRADDLLLGRTVAIKLLREADEMPVEEERIRGESARLASLDHPSLVTLYDAKLDPGHPRYLVMEYVDGPTLSARLTQGPLSRAEVSALATDLAEALQAVHARGIIHRDVKPSNVLLMNAPRGGRCVAKLADFGIAYAPDDARVTSPGVAVGTAAYMAPEQVRALELSPAADIYALGLVLIEALTGHRAFPMTEGVQSALARLAAPPVIPEELGRGWAELLGRMTRTEPGERPSASEVARAVAAMDAGTPPITVGAGAVGAGAVGAGAVGVGAASRADADGFGADSGADADAGAATAAQAVAASASTDDPPTLVAPLLGAGGPFPRRRRRWLAAIGGLGVAIAAVLGSLNLIAAPEAVQPAKTTQAPVPSSTPAEVSSSSTPTEAPAPAQENPAATVDSDTTAVRTTQGGADQAPNPNKGPGQNSGKGDQRPPNSGKGGPNENGG